MRRSIFLCAVSFFSFAAISRGVTAQPIVGQLRTSEFFAKTEETAEGRDIWIYGGAWCYWDGGGVGFGDDIDLAGLIERFFAESGYESNACQVNESEPIPDVTQRLNVYVLDATPLYFSQSDFSAEGLYGFSELNIVSGKINAGEVYAASGIYIGAGCEFSVDGQINSGGTFECYGGTINAGDIYARKIWLDSSQAPLRLTVTDSVLTGFYTQCGGSAEIGGGLFAVSEEGGGERSIITVNGDFAVYNATGLTVGEDIVCAGAGSAAVFGGGSGAGGFDEAAFTAFVVRRSDKKAKIGSVYDLTAKKPDCVVTVTAGGTIRASGDITVYDAYVTAGVTIQSRDGEVFYH